MPKTAYDYDEASQEVRKALEKALPPNSTISTKPGYLGRVHLLVVSEEFAGMSEEKKQKLIWKMLRDELGPNAQYVSLAMVYGPDELM